MALQEDQLQELEALAKKNKSIEIVLNEWKIFMESPYLNSYITLQNQIADFNEQLTIKPDEVRKRVVGNDILGNVIAVDWMPGKIDLFGSKEEKEFDRAFKYMVELPTLLDSLDKIRSKVKPSDLKTAKAKKDLEKASGVAI